MLVDVAADAAQQRADADRQQDETRAAQRRHDHDPQQARVRQIAEAHRRRAGAGPSLGGRGAA